MDANLQLINLDDFKVNDTDVVIDLYPGRKFKSEVVVILWKRESFGNIQYYKYFKNCDDQDIKVTVLCVRNLFPIASQIGHKCIMHTASIEYCMNSPLTKYGLDRKRLWNRYVDVDVSGSVSDPRKEICLYIESGDISSLIEFYRGRPYYMDKKSYKTFEIIQDDLPNNTIWIEAKKRSYRNRTASIASIVKEAVSSCDNAYGLSGIPQLSLIKNYDLDDHFLSMQILCSLKRSVKFIGLAGAGSLFSITPLLNSVFVADSCDNISPACLMFKTCFNESMYDCRTLGGQYVDDHELLNFRKSYLWDVFLSVINNKQEPRIPKLDIKDCNLSVLDHDFSKTAAGMQGR